MMPQQRTAPGSATFTLTVTVYADHLQLREYADDYDLADPVAAADDMHHRLTETVTAALKAEHWYWLREFTKVTVSETAMTSRAAELTP